MVRDSGQAASPRRDTPIRIGAVLALAIAIGFVVWLLVRNDDDNSPKTVTTTAVTTGTRTVPGARSLLVAATPQRLAALAKAARHPIYWAGRKPNTTYELTETRDGRIYVRYLPRGVKIGDRRAAYLIVATYPVKNAYKAVQTAAKENGATTFRVKGGGLAVYNSSAATNVYFAYPGSQFQVEVFDPKPNRARRLVASGAIRPVG